MRVPRRQVKPLLLLAATLVGGGAAMLVLRVQQRLSPALGAARVPPIISVRAAQRQVPFRIRVPDSLPPGSRLDGVRVGQIVVRDPERLQATMRANTKPMIGYGVMTNFDIANNKVFARALPGSPAARAGLGSEQGIQLLDVDGYRPSSAKEEAAQWQAFRPMDHAQKPGVRQRDPPLWRHLHAEPLRLTVKSPDGAIHTMVIPRRETWTFRPEQPQVNAAGNRAALLFTVRGRHFVLHESRSVPGESHTLPPTAKRIVVKGTDIWLSGPPASPTAFWQRDGVDFVMNNYQLVISRQEALRVVESLLGSKGG